MTLRIRSAALGDVPAITALLLEDAKTREALNARLWAIARDAAARVHASLATLSDPGVGPVRHHWMVAEQDNAVVAVTHAVNMPPPPLYDLAGGTAGVLLDDCHFAVATDVSSALLQATEQALIDAGAVLLVAASPSDWTTRTRFLASAGYETTTLYMAKTGWRADNASGTARVATAADIDAITRLSARHRVLLKMASPRFWNTHTEADARFAGWMRISLHLPDRTTFVTGPMDAVDGCIIAQPCSPLLLPPAHDATKIGLIDDFYAVAFEPSESGVAPVEHAVALLTAVESAFHGETIDTALAICPARMSAKADFLRSQGYATANLWMVKGAGSCGICG